MPRYRFLPGQGVCPAGCVYSGTVSGMNCCHYVFIEDKLRPCPAGKDCTEYKKGRKIAICPEQ